MHVDASGHNTIQLGSTKPEGLQVELSTSAEAQCWELSSRVRQTAAGCPAERAPCFESSRRGDLRRPAASRLLAGCGCGHKRKVSHGEPFSGTLTPPIDVADSVCEPRTAAEGHVFNATVAPSGILRCLTLWPDGAGKPLVSTLNAYDGAVTSNIAILPSLDGKTDAYADGTTQLIVDIASYFAP